MADEGGIRTEEGQDGIENKGSFSYMMEHPDEAQGSAASAEDQETPEAKEAREAAEAEAAAAAAAEAAKTETPEQKAAREEAEAEADKTKDWTVEDFRKGYKEAETRMHTATGETVKEKEAREAAEKRAEVAEAKLVEQEVEREKLAAEAARPKPMSEEDQDAIFEKAASDLRDLDPNDPDYVRDYGRIMRKAVAAVKSQALVDPDATSEEIANKAWEKLQIKQTAESAKTAEARQRENQERLDREANDFAKQAGLDMTPGSADYRLFWDIAYNDLHEQDFMKGDKLPPPEEQFKWVTGEAKRLKGQVVEQTEAERKLAAGAQKKNAIMGKGVNFAPSKETPKTKTLSEMY